MKKYLYFSLAAMALASCTSDEFVGGDPGQAPLGNSSEAIGFNSGTANPTRGTAVEGAAAEKLGGNFIVYGFKTTAAETTDGTNTNDEMVFDTYNVNYEAGTANTTQSNTANWEYVGYNAHETSSITGLQSIKYWDYSATGYVFSAVSGTGITATKAETAVNGTAYSMTGKALTVNGTATQYDKGWKVVIPAGGDISTLYASDRLPIEKPTPAGTKYDKVTLTFRALGTKIRFAMYETVPGYEIHVDKFYYKESGATSWSNTTTNFAINGTFKTANTDAETPLYVTYYDAPADIVNRPKVSYNDTEVASDVYGTFGANIQATDAIGTTSAEATYDQSDKSYTMILPFEGASNDLQLYVDYTLTSTDGSGEKIEVKHASAKVPSNFNQWKPNFAYTYIFKISDNTNGTTGNPSDPDDPEADPTDPKGLFPITFDAVVVTDETDVQETITSVADPSITTYQKGVVVTKNDEYEAGLIYFENDALNVANYKVYEVKNFGKETTTEEVVANYLQNFCVLTEVTTTDASTTTPAGIPLSNGTYISKTANQAKFFTAEAGKVYVICDEATPTKHYKVVKVAGSPAAVTYTLSKVGTTDLTAVDAEETLTLEQNGVGVLGAVPCFKITSTNGNSALKIVDGTTVGEYTVSIDAAAIAAGKANDTYTIDFSGKTVTIKVDIAYALETSPVTIVAGNATGATVINKIAGAAADGDVTEVPAGITIEKTATGTYKVTAAADLANGAYTAKIAGQTLNINVDSYAFLSNLVITKALTGTSTGTLTLQKNGAAATGVTTLTGSDDDVATFTAADGVYTFTAVAGGSFDVTYENAAAKVTVNAYTMTASPVAPATSVKKSTGIATIEVKCNGETINANAASLVLTAKPGDVLYANAGAYNTAKGLTGTDALSDVEFAALPYTEKVETAGSVYTVTTNGKTFKFSSASKAGNYKFDYKVDADGDGTLDTVVAQVTVTVVE